MLQKKKTSNMQNFVKYTTFGLILTGLIVLTNACHSVKGTKANNSVEKNKTNQLYEVDEEDMSAGNDEKPEPFIYIKNPPVYPGCEGLSAIEKKNCMGKKIQQFVMSNYNVSLADSLKLNGEKVRILTRFTINKKGKVINIKARSKYPLLAKEAKRVISLLPQMKPGKLNGKTVNVRYTLPIVFRIEEQKNKK